MNKRRMRARGTSHAAGPRPVTVTVTILNDNPPEFDMHSSPPGQVPINKVNTGDTEDFVLTFNNNAGGQYSAGFDVTFEVEDRTDRGGYGFFLRDPQNPDPNDPISVRIIGPTGHCPRRGQAWSGFTPVEASRGSLRISNPNDHLQYFGFALYFSREGQTKPSLIFDPIGDDRNGHA